MDITEMLWYKLYIKAREEQDLSTPKWEELSEEEQAAWDNFEEKVLDTPLLKGGTS